MARLAVRTSTSWDTAHVAGLAGWRLAGDGNGKVAVIIALDPAEPLTALPLRLVTTDASYVHMIKTSNLGYALPVGHSNFYPNSGLEQTVCNLDIGCNHEKAFYFFADTINSPRNGKKCVLVALGPLCLAATKPMGGEPLDTSTTGTFYLTI